MASDISNFDRAADQELGYESLHLVWNVTRSCREYRVCGDDARSFDRVYPIYEESPQVRGEETRPASLFLSLRRSQQGFPNQRQRTAVNAAAHLGDLGDLDGNHLDALAGEQVDGVLPVRREQDFARGQGQAVDG